jgi:hypothetical protein
MLFCAPFCAIRYNAAMIRPRFSLRTFFVTITLLVIVFLWHFNSTRDKQRLCDQAIATALSNIHWQMLGDNKTFQTFNTSLSNSFNQQSPCSTSFLLPSGSFSDGSPADTFEQGLLTDWSKPSSGSTPPTADTATRGKPFGSFTYYKAIRAEHLNCITCHSNPASRPMKLGDIIAISKTIYSN